MLANLMPPITTHTVQLEVSPSPSRRTKSHLSVHPRYRAWLARCGLETPQAFLELHGEILGGHADRHVMKVLLGPHQRVVFIKREHQVGWRVRFKNWRDGFGFVSRSEREMQMLTKLDAMGLPAPQWIASGEDERGRAFILLDGLAGFEDLRAAAARVDEAEIRHDFCLRIGQTLAEFHARGISMPDLAAKHVQVRLDNGGIMILDWPSAVPNVPLTFHDRMMMLAKLDATLSPLLASQRERLRCLRAYCRHQWGQPRTREWVAGIRQLKLKMRSSIRNQQTPREQRLVWLAEDEAVCVIPELAKCWPEPAIVAPFYSSELPGRTELIAPDGKMATLVRYRSFKPFERMMALLRGRPWRSPALKWTRQLIQQASDTRLLAFGQRMTGAFTAESFVLFRKDAAGC